MNIYWCPCWFNPCCWQYYIFSCRFLQKRKLKC